MFTQKQALQQDFIHLYIFKTSWFSPGKPGFVLIWQARPKPQTGVGGATVHQEPQQQITQALRDFLSNRTGYVHKQQSIKQAWI